MSAAANANGLRLAYHPSGQPFAKKYTIASAYNTDIFYGAPVLLNTNGTITVSAGNDDILGVFAGCEYTDADGRPRKSNFWPASTAILAGTSIDAYVYADPDNVFSVDAAGATAVTAVGDQADLSSPAAGSTATGNSSALLGALKGVGVQGQWRIIGLDGAPDNAWGDAAAVRVLVQCARHQFVGNKTAI